MFLLISSCRQSLDWSVFKRWCCPWESVHIKSLQHFRDCGQSHQCWCHRRSGWIFKLVSTLPIQIIWFLPAFLNQLFQVKSPSSHLSLRFSFSRWSSFPVPTPTTHWVHSNDHSHTLRNTSTSLSKRYPSYALLKNTFIDKLPSLTSIHFIIFVHVFRLVATYIS